MTELKIILAEYHNAMRDFLNSGRAPECEELKKVCYLATMFENKFSEVYDQMYEAAHGHAPKSPHSPNYSNAN
jgi:hypothetical protein